jgi:hypothetical protein
VCERSEGLGFEVEGIMNCQTQPPENRTQSHTPPRRHTHCRAVRLPSVNGMLSDSWLLNKPKYLQDTRSAIASHDGKRRCCHAQSVAHHTTKLVSYHQSSQTNQIK